MDNIKKKETYENVAGLPRLEEEKIGEQTIRKQEHPKKGVGLKLKKNKGIDRFKVFQKGSSIRDDEIEF